MEEIVAIGKLIDAQKSAADIAIPYYLDVEALKKGETNWGYGLKVLEKE